MNNNIPKKILLTLCIFSGMAYGADRLELIEQCLQVRQKQAGRTFRTVEQRILANRIKRLPDTTLLRAFISLPTELSADIGSDIVTTLVTGLWTNKTGIPRLISVPYHVMRATINHDGTKIAVWNSSTIIQILDAKNGTVISSQDTGSPYRDTKPKLTPLKWSPQGNYILQEAKDSTISILDVSNNEQYLCPLTIRRNASIVSTYWSFDERFLAICAFDYISSKSSIYIYDRINQKTSPPLHTDVQYVHGLYYNHQGTALALRMSDYSIKIFDIQQNTVTQILRNATYPITWNYSDSHIIAGDISGSSEKKPLITIWDTITGKKIKSIPKVDSANYHAMITPDEQWIITFDGVYHFYLYNILTGENFPAGMNNTFFSPEYSTDGNSMVGLMEHDYYNDPDHKIMIWDTSPTDSPNPEYVYTIPDAVFLMDIVNRINATSGKITITYAEQKRFPGMCKLLKEQKHLKDTIHFAPNPAYYRRIIAGIASCTALGIYALRAFTK